MKRCRFFVVLTLSFIATFLPLSSVSAASLPDFTVLAKELKPAVVNISTSKTYRPRSPIMPSPRSPHNDFFDDFFDRFFGDYYNVPRKERSLGSGFIISPDGYILTNEHVVDGADEVKVKLSDGRSFTAIVKGIDRKLDLALVKIDAGSDLPVVRQGDSDDLKVGEWVMAIGNPFGLEQTVTVGIVSAKGRVIGAGPYDNFIQTDASINPGNSGGPLFNAEGEVVGINTAIVAGGQGIGFAIPINTAKSIVAQLREVGHVVRGWLGVSIQQVSEELAESFGLDRPKGALVSEVVKDSPADKAKIRRGDIILSFDGTEIDTMNDLPRAVAATPAGTKARMTIFRDGKTLEMSVEIGELEEEGGGVVADAGGELGFSVSDVTPDAERNYGLKGARGALVTAVDPVGAASEAGLRPGDLIIEFDGMEIKSAADFYKATKDVKKGEVFRLLVQRGESSFYTTLRLD